MGNSCKFTPIIINLHKESTIETTKEFAEFNLHSELLESLNNISFKNASPIQELTIPVITEGKDIFAQAETGSGKTGSFAIPMIHRMLLRKDESTLSEKPSYVVLSPTRELAQQTHKVFQDLGSKLGITSVSIIGGENIDKQKELLEKGANVVVATPGRLVDLVKQKMIDLSDSMGIVFDEADRLFDMGFQKDIEFVLNKMPKDRQLIMVSATSNQEIMTTAYRHGSEPVELILNQDSLVVDHIDHQLGMMTQQEKMPFLVNILRKKEDVYAIVFCNTQFQTHLVAEWLRQMDFKAKPISGRLAQNKRTKLLEDFRSKKTTILVCTDVAARGLDIKDVNLVINYDLPSEAANYVHRIGRTGRAGETGQAISLCAHEDCDNLDAIYELIESKIPKMKLKDEDFSKQVSKKPFIDRKTLQVVERSSNRQQSKQSETRKKGTRKMDTQNTAKEAANAAIANEAKPQRTDKRNEDRKERSSAPRVDRRYFKITSSNIKAATKQALEFFKMDEAGMLNHEILKQGRKKFFFFGSRETTYNFTIKPIYKKLLLPYLIEMMKVANLDLYVRVSFKEPHLRISFSGKDEELLLENKGEMLRALEQIIKIYLQKKVVLHKGIKFHVSVPKAKGQHTSSSSSSSSKSSKNKVDETALRQLADKLKAQVVDSKESAQTSTLSAAQRRIIHQHLQDDTLVTTSSVGEGRYKKVQVSLN